ncbi:MAG: hypothetical protein ACO1RX_21930 [Candidatus Sericytochromatia bacterium]
MLRFTRLFLTTALLLSSQTVLAQEDRVVLNPALIPATGATAQAFVPKGWQIEAQASGDLNQDGQADLALTLIEVPQPDQAEEMQSRARALVVLFKQAKAYKRAAVANKLLQCTACGGAFYGAMPAPAEVRIEKGVIIVEEEYGSREVTHLRFRFWLDQKSQRFVLIGSDIANHDRMTGVVVEDSRNYLTGKSIVTTSTYTENSDVTAVQTRNGTASRQLLPLEQIDYETF